MKILKAWWHSSSEIVVVFTKDLSAICDLHISGNSQIPGFSVSRPPREFYAGYSSYFIEDGFVNFELTRDNFLNFCDRSDLDYYVCGSFNGWSKAIGDDAWKMQICPDGARRLRIPIENFDSTRRIFLFKFASGDGHWLEPRLDAPNLERDRHGIANLRINFDRTGAHLLIIKFDGVCGLCDNLKISAPEFNSHADVAVAELLFQIYSNSKLGCYLEDSKTRFSIFAPRATSAWVVWNNAGEREKHVLQASSKDGAVWTAKADCDLRGARYMWHIDGVNKDCASDFNSRVPIADPYALAMVASDGPCLVKYHQEPIPNNFNPPSWHDLVIVEAHLRDVLAKAQIDISHHQRLTFGGLTKWLESPDCYLRATGANCVELQPIQEFTAKNYADYEWGYMPVNWFSPASSYATNPEEGSQNEDFAKLIKAFHDANLAVILDVVYNHVGEPNYLVHVDKNYYFEIDSNCALKNFSGCGNDFRAKSPMARRMIIDSLKHLILRYGVDGFRFDLAELLGLGVLKDIEVELKKVKPSIILIAEPWSFRGHIASALRDTGFTSWNDGFREFMLMYAKGEGNFEGFKYFISGSMGGTSRFPSQSVNYLESHDDMCLFDRLTGGSTMPNLRDLSRYKIAYALVLLSHGIPMLAEGFDMLRTKGGKNNTYKDGIANALDYKRGAGFPGLCQWLRKFVEFRLSDKAKALRPHCPVGETFFSFYAGDRTNAAAVLFNADKSMNCPQIFATFNPTEKYVEIAVGGNKCHCFRRIADIDCFDINGLSVLSCSLEYGVLKLPPLSFGLFIND